MTAPARPRPRPSLIELAPDGLTGREQELYLARAVAEGDVALDAKSLHDLVVNLLATVEESQRVNVGLINENIQLKRRLEQHPGIATDSLVPGLEKAYELIHKALQEAS